MFRHGRKLVAKSRFDVAEITEAEFADDVALFTTSRDQMETVAAKFVGGASDWGLTVSIGKTKAMAVGEGLQAEDVAPIQMEEGEIEMVEQFVYLGSK